MPVLKIRHYPDEVLRRKADEVQSVDEELRALARDMAETMYDAPGVGLAAPQVGVSKRLMVIDCSPQDAPPELITAVNPQIVEARGEAIEEEGCLSVPEFYAAVPRHTWVKVRYLDMEGRQVEREAEGLLAVAFQHEIDHLDGVLFIDHLSSLKKSLFRKKYKKIMEQLQEAR
ncbi:MAG: peptide deformylase [Desulfuromonadales bacterium]|nr:peptide deformylase [Desulfuromonadales bacterium]NIR33312.1 peptide deformylase [Desulfuromonadales bacterium]NIS42098.1 peptide deformylase [Desulfuromonadales bacterium]